MKRMWLVACCLLILVSSVIGVTIARGDSTAGASAEAPAKDARPNSLSVKAGEAKVIPLSGKEEQSKVSGWESSDKSVVAVDSGGRIDALKAGSAEITARFKDGSSYVCKVNVSKADKKSEEDPDYTHTTAIIANTDILEENLKKPVQNGRRPYRLHVNRKMNCVTAYTYDDQGKYTVPVRAMICSCGLNNSTILGVYNIYFHTEWHPLANNVVAQYASAIAGDYMFHSVPYTDYSCASLETEEYNKLGSPASLGCIRMAVGDVKWINDNCEEGTIVFLYDGDVPGPLGRPESMHITDLKCQWDPTDDDKENPYADKTPQIKGAKNVTVKAGSGYSMTDGVTATDTCGNDITKKIAVTGNVDADRAGTYRVTYTVTDALHRTAKEDVTVTVEEAEKD